MDHKFVIVLLSLFVFTGKKFGVLSFPANDLPIEMTGFNKEIKEEENPQDGDIGHYDQDDLVHYYTKEILDKNRKVTFDLETGEVTYESDEEVIRILEMVRKDNSTHLISSNSIRNKPGQNMSIPEREKRSTAFIIGTDSRYKISNTSQFPYCAIGQLIKLGSSFCTLVMVGPYHAFTAAHCVYDRSTRRHVTGSYAYIGRTCNNCGTRVDVQKVTTYTEYTRDGNEGYDLAFLILDKTDIHTSCYMDFAYQDPMPTVSMTVCGYPCDKSPNPYQCMYCSDCNDAKIKLFTLSIWGVSKSYQDFERIQYTCDIAGGVSGGPAYTSFNGNTYVSGVHSHGTSDGTVNLASRITKKKFKDACLWLLGNGGTCIVPSIILVLL